MNTLAILDYQLTEDDVKTMLVVLDIAIKVLPSLELEGFNEILKSQTLHYAESAVKRLENLEEIISFNELHAISNALCIADMINYKEIRVDSDSANLCLKHFFNIQKLLDVFEDIDF